MANIPCFLCAQELDQRKDKNQKPYFVCNPCGVQIFVRGRQGIHNLAELINTIQEREFPFHEHALVLHQIQAILAEIRGVKKELESLGGFFDFLSEDTDQELARELLKTRITNLLSQLEQIATDGAIPAK